MTRGTLPHFVLGLHHRRVRKSKAVRVDWGTHCLKLAADQVACAIDPAVRAERGKRGEFTGINHDPEATEIRLRGTIGAFIPLRSPLVYPVPQSGRQRRTLGGQHRDQSFTARIMIAHKHSRHRTMRLAQSVEESLRKILIVVTYDYLRGIYHNYATPFVGLGAGSCVGFSNADSRHTGDTFAGGGKGANSAGMGTMVTVPKSSCSHPMPRLTAT